jgi:serine/threonine-protein kinase
MAQEDWPRIKEALEHALGLDPGKRPAFLADTFVDDPQARERVERLLAASQRPLPWLSGPVFEVAEDLLTPDPPTIGAGRKIGPFEILRELGHGGMGAIYLARRADQQFEQEVAIKLTRREVASEETERRFRQERQILASLQHPNIARLLGGDVTADGQPYLVMEHIEGEPIDVYCERLGLSISARIELFLKVCAAVQYAHGHLVVHCDLKPSNVLVTADGVPKLLDFGISRLLGSEFVPSLATTAALGRGPMTPEFASPEQVRGERPTTASDIYSLGVMLYRLLTGRSPYRFEGHGLQEVQHVLCEVEPERPSLAVARPLPEKEHGVPGLPGLRRERLRRRLAGDLDNIVMMALRKDVARRYLSVEQMAEDLRRHLAGLPVIARKDTFAYRAGKFLRRHRLGLAAAALVLISLLAGLWMANAEREKAVRERERAEQERTKAEAVATFLEGLFADADSSGDFSAGTLLADPKARAARELLLDEGARRAQAELSNQPLVQARLMQRIGDAYRNLASFEKADRLVVQSLETRQRILGEHDLAVAASYNSLCLLRLGQGDLESAEEWCRRGLELRETAPESSPLLVAESLNSLSLVLSERGRFDEAESLQREALRIRRAHLPDGDRAVTTSLNNLAALLKEKGSYAEAETLFREVLARKQEHFDAEHLQVANAFSNLAAVLQSQGSSSEAEERYQQALEICRTLYGEEHPLAASVHHNLGTLLFSLGRTTETLENLETALRIDRNLLGEGHPDVGRDLNSLGTAYARAGRIDAAEAALTHALEIRQQALGEAHPFFRDSLFSLASLWLQQDQDSKAQALLEGVIDRWRQSAPQEVWALPQAKTTLGASYLRVGRWPEAEPLLQEGYEGLRVAVGAENRLTQTALSCLVELYRAWDQAAQAERYRGLFAPDAPRCPYQW